MPTQAELDYEDALYEWIKRNPFRQWRRLNGLTQHAAAAKIGISHSTVNNWEKGLTIPSRQHSRILREHVSENIADHWNKWMLAMPEPPAEHPHADEPDKEPTA